MAAAVGEAWWPTHLGKIARRLKPGGRAVVLAITIVDERFDHYRWNVDFIQPYIFSGGCLPSKAALCHEFERAGPRLVSSEAFGHSYARTLVEWQRRFPDLTIVFAAYGTITSATARRAFLPA